MDVSYQRDIHDDTLTETCPEVSMMKQQVPEGKGDERVAVGDEAPVPVVGTNELSHPGEPGPADALAVVLCWGFFC